MTPQQRQKHEGEGLFTLKKNPGAGLCGVKGCRKDAPRMGLCHAHRQYRWRMQNKKQSAFSSLRDHALSRGIRFTLDYQYFLGLTDALGYFDPKAESRGEWLSIDRIDVTRGYEPGNLRIVTHSENVIKGHRERHLPEAVQSMIARKRARALVNPFLRDEGKNPF